MRKGKISGIVFSLVLSASAAAQTATSHNPCEIQSTPSRQKDLPKARAFFEQFRTAVGRNEREAVAKMVSFPLHVNGKYRVMNRNAFLRIYDSIFDPRVREGIKTQRSECVFGNWQGFTIATGGIWFDYPPNRTGFKLKAVNNSKWLPEGVQKNGVIPDQATAVSIAEDAFRAQFGQEETTKFRPYHAKLKGDVWIVYGTFKQGARTGTPIFRIHRFSGEVLEVSHLRRNHPR